MHAISSYRGNRPTDTHTHTDRTDYNTLRRISVHCNQQHRHTCPSVSASWSCPSNWSPAGARLRDASASTGAVRHRQVSKVVEDDTASSDQQETAV